MLGQIHDVAVIGTGIAGVSAAAEHAGEVNVLLIEKESHPGYHSTGRSAAMLAPGYGPASYGPASIRSLMRASLNWEIITSSLNFKIETNSNRGDLSV
ncbi:MAG: FAD-dependent oxidoreductase [Granulosicoccus sp.]